jgi:hypothetical protein
MSGHVVNAIREDSHSQIVYVKYESLERVVGFHRHRLGAYAVSVVRKSRLADADGCSIMI